MKNNKILIAGNSVIDLIFQSSVFDKRKKGRRLSLALGGKYVCEKLYQFFGGGGANTAVSLAKQGFNPVLWTYLANDDFGHRIKRHLIKEKVSSVLIKFKAKQTPISSIFLTKSGERTIVTFHSDANQLKLTSSVLQEFKKNGWFSLFSLSTCPKKDKILFLKTAKKNGLKTFISLHGSEYYRGFNYLKDYFPFCDILHLNAHELADIFGGNAPDFDFHKTNFAHKLNIPFLLVTYDIHGNFAYTKDKIYFQPIVKPKKVVDTTGAGDAFASGFLGKYLKTDSIPQALLYGAKNSSSVIQKLGAQNGLLNN